MSGLGVVTKGGAIPRKALRYMALGVVLCSMLAGCESTGPEPRVITQRVEVPISVPCAVRVGPAKPDLWTAAQVAQAEALFGLGNLLYAAYLQERARRTELEAANAGCAG